MVDAGGVMISFPVNDRGSLRAQLAPSATQAIELEHLPDWLFPIHDLADLARKQLAAKVWQSRLTNDARHALYQLVPPVPLCAAVQSWRNVFWFVFVPPRAQVCLQGSRTFKWRIYAGGLPYYQEGWSDAYGEARLNIGWGVSFVAVDCLLAPGETVRQSFEAFPARPQALL
jgi:hypothetical protein